MNNPNKNYCTSQKIAAATYDAVNKYFGDFLSAPINPWITDNVGASISLLSYLTTVETKSYTISERCSDYNFKELKDKMRKRFNYEYKKREQYAAGFKLISEMIGQSLVASEKLRSELQRSYDEVINSSTNLKIDSIITRINNFVKYFDEEKTNIEGMLTENYFKAMDDPNNVLVNLSETSTPRGDILHAPLFEIIKLEMAIPKTIDDQEAFQALNALVYGAQTYVSVMFFVLDQYTYLANHYYMIGNLDEYNTYFDGLLKNYSELRALLVGNKSMEYSEPLLENVNDIVEKVKNLDFVKRNTKVFEKICEKVRIIEEDRKQIENFRLPIVIDTPRNFVQFSFKNSLPTPLGSWVPSRTVSYAVQYEKGNAYSKIGDWSKPFEIRDKACPRLVIPVDQSGNTRLVFRKFDNDLPQLIGSIGPLETEFLDVHRDLYDAVSLDKQKGLKEVNTLISAGASINAVFEKGRTVLHAAATKGKGLIALRYILGPEHISQLHNHPDINLKDLEGNTALHIAAKHGETHFLEMLLQHNADVNAKTYSKNLTPLHLTAEMGFVASVEALLRSDLIDVNSRDSSGFSPLHYAVLGGKESVRILVSKPECDVNSQSKTGLTPFHLAAINNKVSVAETLIGSGNVDVNIGDIYNMTPLHYAAMLGNIEMVRYISSLPYCDVNTMETFNYLTPLHISIAFKKDDISSILINHPNAYLYALTQAGDTPLHYAAAFGRRRAFEELLRKSVDQEIETYEGYSPIHIAAMQENPEMLIFLIGNQAHVHHVVLDNSTPLHFAAMAGQAINVVNLLNAGADIKSANDYGELPIHKGVKSGNVDVVRAILNHDPSLIEAKDKKGFTPLLAAAEIGDFNMVKIFTSNGANVNARDMNGKTALHMSAFNGKIDIVQYLLEHNADPFITANNKKATVLYYAVVNDHLDVLKYLMKDDRFRNVDGIKGNIRYIRNAVCDAVRYQSYNVLRYFLVELQMRTCNPLHTASWFGHIELVQFLVEDLNLKVDGPSGIKDTPLCEASSTGKATVVKYLLDNGADIKKGCFHFPPLDSAIRSGSLETLKILLEHGADAREADMAGNTPLHHAASAGNVEIVQYLVDTQNVGINDVNANKETPLHNAAKTGSLPLVMYLVEKGADVSARDKQGKTPQDVSIDQKATDLLQSRAGRFFRSTNFTSMFNCESKSGSSPLSLIGEGKEESNFSNFSVYSRAQKIDVLGTILLFDLLIRKFTNQKFVDVLDKGISEQDAVVNALKMTENFENLISSLSNVPAVEQMDLSEVYSKTYKILKSGENGKLRPMLCSYFKTLDSVKPPQLESLNEITSHWIKTLKTSSEETQMYQNLSPLIIESCYSTPLKQITNPQI